MLRLKKRSEFLTAAKGVRLSRRGFVLQAVRRLPEDDKPARVGFTVTKKVGNAVVRNRVKRRLRELARLHGPDHLSNGWDYVLIGKLGGLHLPFEGMIADFKGCTRDLARGKTEPQRKRRPKDGSDRGQKSNKPTRPDPGAGPKEQSAQKSH
ncbi:ribonuclease P protein component [Cohaesibacter sp. CAU 1516]|uniref:ribonuclease P protein component n=1 Tax=Cohaesibacter sp. CAU 1516 TaxID=2576038 RepID=UPI0010FE58F3|nr:ribonuclease P protein component [Cohaesibacter sp. CAU 1516]TLP47148.1 ribonuclease P protein component [Cohaesibacter sp. CAU 1516]